MSDVDTGASGPEEMAVDSPDDRPRPSEELGQNVGPTDATKYTEESDGGDDDNNANDDGVGDSDDDGDGEGGNEEGSGSSEDESSEEESDDEPGDGLSTYEKMRLERIARNQARLASLGFDDNKKAESKPKKKTPAKPRKSLVPDGPRRQLPGRAKRATFNESAMSASAKKERFQEMKNMDACYTCQKEEGEMMSCNYCRKLYHPDCHDPPISPNDEDFKCKSCVGSGRNRRMACGKCEGCIRLEDCGNCVACINARSKGRCIFRRCQSWGKAKLVRANTGDSSNVEGDEPVEEEEDHHDADCFVCKNGGDLICCDGCTKVYHAYCHKPRLNVLPEGDWFCMECAPQKKAPKEKTQRYTGPLVADLGHCEVMCTVRFPKIECLVCEEEEVTGTFRPPDWITCRACDDSYHLGCLDPPLDSRPNKWRCPPCKERKVKIKKQKEEKEEKPQFEGVHDDDCFMCFNGGDLLCCDFCEKAYHLKCHIPPLTELPKGLWKCQECAAVEYTRKMKCGECKACLADECGKCEFCLDKPKFGGRNKLKQACIAKRCPYMRFAPPAKKDPLSTSKKKKKEIKAQFAEGSSKKKRKRSSMGGIDDGIRFKSGGVEGSDGKSSDSAIGDVGKKRGRPAKRQKAEGGEPMDTEKLAEAAKKQGDSAEAEEIKKIVNGRPLKDDIVGNKVRLIIVKALKHPKDYKMQDKACELLRFIANNADNSSKIILLGGLRLVSIAMKGHPDKSIVQAEASALLAELTWINPSCIAAIIDEGCLQLVLTSMQSHGSHDKVQQMGAGFFRAMSYEFATHQSIHRINGVGGIIEAMMRNSNKYNVLKEGCYFLQNILCNPEITAETVDLIVSKGTIPLIIDAKLNASSDDTDYLEAACGVLANLAINESAREHIGSYGTSVSTLLTVLGPGMSENACKCAMNALRLLAMGSEEVNTKIGSLGGIKTIVAFLTPSNDVALVDAGMRLLVELTKSSSAGNVWQPADTSVFEFVTNKMSKHPSLSFVQASCCGVLRNIPVKDVDQANSTVSSILEALKNHKEDKVVQFEGCHVLLQYCSQFQTIAKTLQSKVPSTADVRSSKRKRGLPSKLQKVEESSGEVSQEAKSSSPTKIIAISDAADTISNSSEIESIIKSKPPKDDPVGNKIRLVIIKALKNPDDYKMQDKACEILRSMATNIENASKIVQFGGLKMVSKAMSDHLQKSIVQAEASALLAELAWTNPSCIAAIANEGCLQLILISMQMHAKHIKVVQMGCGFFRAMSYDFAFHPHIHAVNGLGVVIDSMKTNRKKYDILKEGCYFLQNILCNPAITTETIDNVVSHGIIPLIIDAVAIKSGYAEFVSAACGAVANLAIDETAREHIQSYAESIPTLLAVVGSGIDLDACRCAMNGLKHLATGNDDVKAKINQLEGIRTLMDFLSPPNDATLVDSGFGLLSELIKGNKENSQMLLDSGVFDFVIAEMANNSESPHLQARACEVLHHLPVSAGQSKDAVSLILTAMGEHEEDSVVQYEGCKTLLQIICRFPNTAEALLSAEAQSSLCQSQFMLPTVY